MWFDGEQELLDEIALLDKAIARVERKRDALVRKWEKRRESLRCKKIDKTFGTCRNMAGHLGAHRT